MGTNLQVQALSAYTEAGRPVQKSCHNTHTRASRLQITNEGGIHKLKNVSKAFYRIEIYGRGEKKTKDKRLLQCEQ